MAAITIYTDGAASGNPGPGGLGVLLIAGPHRKELSFGFRKTTNNRMELLAVILGLEALRHPDMEVTVYSDSRYVVDAVEKGWVFGWEKKAFKDKKTPTCGNASSSSTAGTAYASSGSRDMPTTPATNAATNWQCRHTNSPTCSSTDTTNPPGTPPPDFSVKQTKFTPVLFHTSVLISTFAAFKY